MAKQKKSLTLLILMVWLKKDASINALFEKRKERFR